MICQILVAAEQNSKYKILFDQTHSERKCTVMLFEVFFETQVELPS